jgi:Holliday junction resolvase RusA-like endonuclease
MSAIAGVHLYIEELPPYKQTPADAREKELQEQRSQVLREAAHKAYDNQAPFKGPVELAIGYMRHDGKSDSANIVGGIADALIKVIYKDDSQIKEIRYSETTGVKDCYWIEVRSRNIMDEAT